MTQLWHSYGMRTSKKDMSNWTPSNHYFLQGISEHIAVEWSSWNEVVDMINGKESSLQENIDYYLKVGQIPNINE